MANLIPLVRRPALTDDEAHAILMIATACNRPQLVEEIGEGLARKTHFLFSSDDGFVILKPFVVDGVASVQVVVAHTWEFCNAIERYSDTIDALAGEIGAQQLEFWTVRAGFEKVAPAAGWTKSFTIWRKPLCASSAIR